MATIRRGITRIGGMTASRIQATALPFMTSRVLLECRMRSMMLFMVKAVLRILRRVMIMSMLGIMAVAMPMFVVVVVVVVVTMVMAMIMVVCMILRMTVTLRMTMTVIMHMTMRMAVRGALVGTGLGLERGLFDHDVQAHLDEHIVEHMVVLVACKARADLQGHVAIAQVIAGTGQLQGIVAVQGGDGFGRRLDAQQVLAGFIGQHIATAQRIATRQDEAGLTAPVQCDAGAASDAHVDGQRGAGHLQGGGQGFVAIGQIQPAREHRQPG